MNLKELSTKLGLSQTTVSRALNGYPEVREETRLKVQQMADKYNYRPSSQARRLAMGRTMSIGHVLTVSGANEMVNPVFADFIAGAGEVYSKSGYDMVLSVVNDAEEETHYREIAAKKSVDGIIVHGPRSMDPRIDLLRSVGLPFAVHGRTPGSEADYTWLDVNNKRAFQRATDFLIDLGHHRIALLNGLSSLNFALRRRQGYMDALTSRGVEYDDSLVFFEEMTEHYGYRIASEQLEAENAPTAFLTSSILVAMGVRRAVQELGLVVGKDVSILTHDDDLSYMQNTGEVPMFTATRSSVRDAGRKLAELLIHNIENPSDVPSHVLWEAQLVVGASTGPAPLRAAQTDYA